MSFSTKRFTQRRLLIAYSVLFAASSASLFLGGGAMVAYAIAMVRRDLPESAIPAWMIAILVVCAIVFFLAVLLGAFVRCDTCGRNPVMRRRHRPGPAQFAKYATVAGSLGEVNRLLAVEQLVHRRFTCLHCGTAYDLKAR